MTPASIPAHLALRGWPVDLVDVGGGASAFLALERERRRLLLQP